MMPQDHDSWFLGRQELLKPTLQVEVVWLVGLVCFAPDTRKARQDPN